tara:strand:+ start:15625 stop:16020 length:396 start_codon:yes stop_codon:yes gene_type:complete
MKKNLFLLIFFLFISLGEPGLSSAQEGGLPNCVVISHCEITNWKVNDIDKGFQKAKKLIEETPRTRIIELTDSYLHAEATTRWMHYVDDLELKAIKEEGVLQVRSESRVGIGDNGVNKKRIDDLSYRMSIN